MLTALLALAVGQAGPFAKWDKDVAAIEKRLAGSPPGGVVFAGSSSIRLWDLAQSFPGKGYLNAGFGGSTVPACTHFAARLVAVHRPKTVVFYAGDINAGATPETVRDDFAKFAAAVPDARILFVAIKPSVARWKLWDRQAKANALVQEFVATQPRLGYVDTATPMLATGSPPAADLFVKDGLHLSAKGYAMWTKLVATELAK